MFVKGYDFRTFGFINMKVLFKMRSPGNETTTLSMCCDVSIHRNGYFGEFEQSKRIQLPVYKFWLCWPKYIILFFKKTHSRT